jgi:hypothetical protein
MVEIKKMPFKERYEGVLTNMKGFGKLDYSACERTFG